MTNQIDDAIRIARREAELGSASRPTDRAVSTVFAALATMPDPDKEGAPIKEDWRWESDGTGPVAKRRDQYIVADGELERIATFEGPDAAKNARAASCTPLMIATLKIAMQALSTCIEDIGGDRGEAHEALRQIEIALKETRFRRSG